MNKLKYPQRILITFAKFYRGQNLIEQLWQTIAGQFLMKKSKFLFLSPALTFLILSPRTKIE